jgi:hypothetical protein
MENQL